MSNQNLPYCKLSSLDVTLPLWGSREQTLTYSMWHPLGQGYKFISAHVASHGKPHSVQWLWNGTEVWEHSIFMHVIFNVFLPTASHTDEQAEVSPDSIPCVSHLPSVSMRLFTNCTIVLYYYMHHQISMRIPTVLHTQVGEIDFPDDVLHRGWLPLAGSACLAGMFLTIPINSTSGTDQLQPTAQQTRLWKNGNSASLFHICPASLHSL